MASPTGAKETAAETRELTLVVRDQDIPSDVRAHITAVRQHRRVLGADEKSPEEWILEALPGVIARRVRPILPNDFELYEMQMTISLSGKPFGIGVSGNVLVTLRRSSAVKTTDGLPGDGRST